MLTPINKKIVAGGCTIAIFRRVFSYLTKRAHRRRKLAGDIIMYAVPC